jgi:hypothetical protein
MEGEEIYPDLHVSANPSAVEYLTDVKSVISFVFISGKTGFLFVTDLKDVYTTRMLYRSSDGS